MTPETLLFVVGGAVAGFAAASIVMPFVLRSPPAILLRTNVSGREVPAILGTPLVVGGLAGMVAVAGISLPGWTAELGRVGWALAVLMTVMAAAGWLDDRRGDEGSRGFKGHLGALARGRLTGGALKIVAGAVAGLGAAVLLFPDDAPRAVATVVLVAGGANLINLFDRAPGRAAKVALLLLIPLLSLGEPRWAVGAAGVAGALMACLPLDLAEKAMLGDAGANPLGAVTGLGLALSLDGWALWLAVVLVVALNLASERWSFSQAIARTPWLDSLDRAGRK